MEFKINRRKVLLSGAAAAVGSFGASRLTWAQAGSGEIAMGVITQQTGAYAFAGDLIIKGATFAVEERNSQILGRKIKLVTRDDEGKPAVGVRRLSEVISGDRVKFFGGNASSSVGLAEMEVAQREKVLQYSAGGAEEFTGSRCSRYTFHWSPHPYTGVLATLEYVKKALPQKKRIYSLTADYALGHSLLKYSQVVGKELGFELVGNDNHPLGERQFTQYLTKALAAKPDIICLNNYGADAVTAIRQLHSFGVKGMTVIGPWTMESEQLRELAPEMREGLILGQNYYHEIDTPLNKAFVANFSKKFGAPPTYMTAYGYDSFRSILLAMEKANSVEVADVIRTLESSTWEGILGKMSINASHQTVRPYYVIRCKAQNEMRNDADFAEIVAQSVTPQPAQFNECKAMPGI